MSDDWQVPDDLADRIRRLDRTDAWAREIERTAEVRAILTDLIAELRNEHYPHPCTDPEDFPCCCESCAGAWPCLMADMADRAEARLKSRGLGHE